MDSAAQLLTKEELLSMDDIPIEEVVVPEWRNRTVLVCGLSAAAKNAYQASLVEIKGSSRRVRMENATAKLLVLTVLGRDRKAMFRETDIERLGAKSAAALERLAKVANRLSGMDEQENAELVKNSEAAQSADSPTVSL